MADLCRRCGLCCDGTLFISVTLEQGEFDWARAHALPLLDEKGKPYFRQRCGCLAADGLCSAYATRPATCQQFKCHLLRRLEAGEISEELALASIAQAQALRDLTAHELPGDTSLLERLEGFVKSLGSSDAPADDALLALRRDKRQLISDVAVLSVLLRQQFRGPEKKKDGAGG